MDPPNDLGPKAIPPDRPALEHARDLLMTAAEMGQRSDVYAATHQVVIVLGQRRLLA